MPAAHYGLRRTLATSIAPRFGRSLPMLNTMSAHPSCRRARSSSATPLRPRAADCLARSARRKVRLSLEPLETRTLLTYSFGFVNGVGSYDIRALAVAADSAGAAYVTGAFRGTAD